MAMLGTPGALVQAPPRICDSARKIGICCVHHEGAVKKLIIDTWVPDLREAVCGIGYDEASSVLENVSVLR